MLYFNSKVVRIFLIVLYLYINTRLDAQKTIYIPSFITNSGMDLNDNNSQWSYKRSLETDDFVFFWEPGFGDDPSFAPAPYNIDMQTLITVSNKTFNFYVDSLQFAVKDSSVTDKYKQMIFLLYTTDWAAYGSGQDDLVGSLFVSPAAANIKHVVAHEIGHCFQYITGCDSEGGFRYGFGENGAGGNGFWEQCAQWQAYKVYPELQFTEGDFTEYIKNNHLHILHENPRYANYFLPDFWTYKHGANFMGRLWREARYPEDPVEAYKRLNGINQEKFNDEMYEHAARLTTWDLPSLKDLGTDYIVKRPQIKMTKMADDYWQIVPDQCIENYGYNAIKLNVPERETAIKVDFKGLAGAPGFRSIHIDQAGWKLGFVALLKDGSRVYSDVGTAKYNNGTNPDTSLQFICPNDCEKLWLVVSGAPQIHWRHAWDDDNSNDEQWPYQVKFENTNLLGKSTGPLSDVDLTYDVIMEPRSNYNPNIVELNIPSIIKGFALPQEEIAQYLGTDIKYFAINPDNSLDPNSTAFYPGHWFDNTGKVTNWGNNSYIYSELDINNFTVKIGQYPDVCKIGDKYTIKQALEYIRNETDTARLTLVFNISIMEMTSANSDVKTTSDLMLFPNPTSSKVDWAIKALYTLFDINGIKLKSGFGSELDLSTFINGLYFLKIGEKTYKIVKQ